MRTETPSSPEQAADAMRSIASQGQCLRPVGGGTKQHWGNAASPVDVTVSTSELAGILEHNAADMTAILRPGVRLADAHEAFAESGQMLALDPPLGRDDSATIGGVVAATDSGPLRHRYGAARDLLLGMQVALSDGTLARSGGKVIKNVAGYDLAKLFSGSFGTLGLITEVVVRLHPLPRERVTVICESASAPELQRLALSVATAALEVECLDFRWSSGSGAVLARLAGSAAQMGAKQVLRLASDAGLDGIVTTEEKAWTEQRANQRSPDGVGVRVSALATELAGVAACAERVGARVVGRAGVGVSWLTLPAGDAADLAAAVEEIREELSPRVCVVLDAPSEVRTKVDVWGEARPSEVALMRRVKERFDPKHACNPGVFVGGI